MRTTGFFENAQRNLNGDLVVSFVVEDESVLEELEKDKKIILTTQKFSEKRSNNANSYFWVLCDMIAKKLGTTKDEIYLLELSRYGFWLDKEVIKESVPEIRKMFRLVEEFNDDYQIIEDDGTIINMVTIRCYIGSSNYTRSEMAALIDGTQQDAKEIGCDLWSQEEVERLINTWRPRNEKN